MIQNDASCESFEFVEVTPQEVLANKEAMRFLEMGAKNFGGLITVEKTLKNAVQGQDIFIFLKNAIKLRAAIHLTITQQETGKTMTSVLLGGMEFNEWYGELREFYYKLAKLYTCDQFTLMGRRGFKKFFPELKEVATLFSVRIT